MSTKGPASPKRKKSTSERKTSPRVKLSDEDKLRKALAKASSDGKYVNVETLKVVGPGKGYFNYDNTNSLAYAEGEEKKYQWALDTLGVSKGDDFTPAQKGATKPKRPQHSKGSTGKRSTRKKRSKKKSQSTKDKEKLAARLKKFEEGGENEGKFLNVMSNRAVKAGYSKFQYDKTNKLAYEKGNAEARETYEKYLAMIGAEAEAVKEEPAEEKKKRKKRAEGGAKRESRAMANVEKLKNALKRLKEGEFVNAASFRTVQGGNPKYAYDEDNRLAYPTGSAEGKAKYEAALELLKASPGKLVQKAKAASEKKARSSVGLQPVKKAILAALEEADPDERARIIKVVMGILTTEVCGDFDVKDTAKIIKNKAVSDALAKFKAVIGARASEQAKSAGCAFLRGAIEKLYGEKKPKSKKSKKSEEKKEAEAEAESGGEEGEAEGEAEAEPAETEEAAESGGESGGEEEKEAESGEGDE